MYFDSFIHTISSFHEIQSRHKSRVATQAGWSFVLSVSVARDATQSFCSKSMDSTQSWHIFGLSHIMLCYSLNLKWITFRCFFVICIHTYPIMSKWNYVFHFLLLLLFIKNVKLKCLDSISIQTLCYGKPK